MRIQMALFSYKGVCGETVDSLIHEIAFASARGHEIQYGRVGEDALISRSRSRCASRFLDASNADVLLMLDHDIAWEPGDATRMCESAVERRAFVAGLYSCRGFGKGVASRLAASGPVTIGETGMLPATYLAAGFLAISRAALARVQADEFQIVGIGKLRAYFAPMIVDGEYLSEDWSSSSRATAAGVPLFVDSRARLRHIGEYAYVVPDAVGEPPR